MSENGEVTPPTTLPIRPSDCDDPDNDPSDEEDHPRKSHREDSGWINDDRARYFQNETNSQEFIPSYTSYHSLSISGLMNYYIGKSQYSGPYYDDLDGCVQIFETIATMYEVSYIAKNWAMPIILCGDVLAVRSLRGGECKN